VQNYKKAIDEEEVESEAIYDMRDTVTMNSTLQKIPHCLEKKLNKIGDGSF
jgi:hypothetical protein